MTIQGNTGYIDESLNDLPANKFKNIKYSKFESKLLTHKSVRFGMELSLIILDVKSILAKFKLMLRRFCMTVCEFLSFGKFKRIDGLN